MLRRLLAFGAALAGLVHPAQAQPAGTPAKQVSANSAPAAWIAYAKLVEQQLENQLTGDSTPAQRLRTYLQSGTQSQASTIPVGIWVDLKGKVTRASFPPFLDSQANADLSGLLEGAHLTQPPPKDMLLPIHLKLQIAPSPAAQAANPPAGSAPPPQH